MEQFRAVIVDDENHAAEILQWEIERSCQEVKIVQVFNEPEEALVFLKEHPIDLLFLDIEMPGMNGFDLLRGLNEINFGVIFTTAYDQFAIEAIRLSAVDYLLKPVNQKDIRSAVDRFIAQHRTQTPDGSVQVLMKYLAQSQMGKVAIPTPSGFEFFSAEDIFRCESDSNYTSLYFSDGRKMVLTKTLKEMEDILAPHGFIRVHNSHLVNGNVIRSFVRSDGGYVVLTDGSHISVSRARKSEFLERFK